MLAIMIDSRRGDNGDYDWAIKLGRGHSVTHDIGTEVIVYV